MGADGRWRSGWELLTNLSSNCSRHRRRSRVPHLAVTEVPARVLGAYHNRVEVERVRTGFNTLNIEKESVIVQSKIQIVFVIVKAAAVITALPL